MNRDKVKKIGEYLENEFGWNVLFSKKQCPKNNCFYTTNNESNNYCPEHGEKLEITYEERGLDELEEAINNIN